MPFIYITWLSIFDINTNLIKILIYVLSEIVLYSVEKISFFVCLTQIYISFDKMLQYKV